MSQSQSGDVGDPEKPVRPSWEHAEETRRPTPPPRQTPATPPAYMPPLPIYNSSPAAYALPQSEQAPPMPSAYSAGRPAVGPGVWSPQPSPQRPGASAYSAPANRAAPEKLLLGILLGLGIGIIGGILIEKILFYAHFGLSLLYVGMGYGIGWGIHRVMGRGGPGLAMLAVGLMVACLGVSHLVYAQDILSEARQLGNVDPRVTALDVFPAMLGSLGIMHWVCITFGLLACYRGVEQQSS